MSLGKYRSLLNQPVVEFFTEKCGIVVESFEKTEPVGDV